MSEKLSILCKWYSGNKNVNDIPRQIYLNVFKPMIQAVYKNKANFKDTVYSSKFVINETVIPCYISPKNKFKLYITYYYKISWTFLCNLKFYFNGISKINLYYKTKHIKIQESVKHFLSSKFLILYNMVFFFYYWVLICIPSPGLTLFSLSTFY